MHLTGPGLTGVTVFTQRLLGQGCESHRQLLPPGFSLSFTACWSSSSRPQQPCFLVDLSNRYFLLSSPRAKTSAVPATSSILMQSSWPDKLCSGYFFPGQRNIRTLALISTTELRLPTVNSSFKRFSLMARPFKAYTWECPFLFSFVSMYNMNKTASQKVIIFQCSIVVVFTLGHQFLRTVPISPQVILMAPVIGSNCWGNAWFIGFVHAEYFHGIHTKCTC